LRRAQANAGGYPACVLPLKHLKQQFVNLLFPQVSSKMRLQPQSDMASRKAFLLFFVNLFVSWVSATPLAGERVLAVIEEQYENAKYSQFLMDLRGKAPVNFLELLS